MSADTLVATIPKNANEEIRITTVEFQRKQYIGIRVFFQADDGRWLPTKKGVTIKTSLAAELIEALQKAAS